MNAVRATGFIDVRWSRDGALRSVPPADYQFRRADENAGCGGDRRAEPGSRLVVLDDDDVPMQCHCGRAERVVPMAQVRAGVPVYCSPVCHTYDPLAREGVYAR